MKEDKSAPLRIVVLDDDPTGSQTVHGNLLLIRWDKRRLGEALTDAVPFFYVLTNTRAMPADEARKSVRELVTAIIRRNESLGQRLLFISRSDSTLRGHFPAEIEEIQHCLGGPEVIDAVFVVPAFFEGGRFTRGGTHYIIENGLPKPCDQTEFARDSVFGYASSHLPDWIDAKTAGRVPASAVKLLDRELLHDPGRLRQFLLSLRGGVHVAVDASDYHDLEVFSGAVRVAIDEGSRFLFQSAASLVKAITGTPSRPLLTSTDLGVLGGPGIVVVGSHVDRTSRQLDVLLQSPRVQGVEVDVGQVLMGEAKRASVLEGVVRRIADCAATGRSPVVMTSRRELTFEDHASRLQAGQTIADFLAQIVRNLPFGPSFVVLKGGITSHVVLDQGLKVAVARVLGQVLPGVSVIRLPDAHPLGPVPVAIFPGNVGDDAAMLDAVHQMGAI